MQKMRVGSLAAIALCALVATTVRAEEPRSQYSAAFLACEKARPTGDDQVCYDAEIKHQKDRLAAAWQRVYKGKTQEKMDALGKAQAEWLRWRNDEYNYVLTNVSGDATTVQVVANQFLLGAIARQAALYENIADMEGD